MRTWGKTLGFGAAMAALGALITALVLPREAPAPEGTQGATPRGEPRAGGQTRTLEPSPVPEPARGDGPEPSAREAAALAEIARLQRELAELQRKAQFQQAFAAGMHAKVDPSRPLPWPEGMPPEHRPEGFAAVLRDARAACPALDAVVRDTHCDEPPCFVVLTAGMSAYRAAMDCEAWTRVYGKAVSLWSREACDGGSPGAMTLLSPSWDGWEGEGPGVAAVLSKRIHARYQALMPDCD